jgi:hypothetical protein
MSPAHCSTSHPFTVVGDVERIIHPAVLKAEALRDKPEDYSYQEYFFVRRVREILATTALTEVSAADLFGRESKAYQASCDLAKRQESADLSTALRYFEMSVEQQEHPSFDRQAAAFDRAQDYRKNWVA